MSSFNPSKLTLARQYRALSQKSLAALCEITPAALSKFENDFISPTDSTVKRFTKVLDFPPSFFYSPSTNLSIFSFHAYRKKASASAAEIYRTQAEMALKSGHQDLLHAQLSLEDAHLPQINSFDPENLAKTLRVHWGVGTEPIANLTQLIESLGIDIFVSAHQDAAVDGVTARSHSGKKAIFINKHQPCDRFRFSLAHELYHYIAHADELVTSEDMEKQANDFAAHLLMPREAIFSQLQTTDLRRYLELKNEWRSSIAALIYRAKELGAISPSQSTSLYKLISMKGWRKAEPIEFEAERPKRINDLLVSLELCSGQPLTESLQVSAATLHQLYPDFCGVSHDIA